MQMRKLIHKPFGQRPVTSKWAHLTMHLLLTICRFLENKIGNIVTFLLPILLHFETF